MNRRAVLASTGAVSGSLLSGCLGRLTGYEECQQTVIRMENLPSTVANEVQTAVEDGFYETNGSLYLTQIMDPDSSYIRAERESGSDPRIYYQPVIESRDGSTRLTIEDALPTKSGPVELKNWSGRDVSVSVRVHFEPGSETFDDEVLVDEDFEIADGERATLVSEDIPYGSYSIEMESHSENKVVESGWSLRTALGRPRPTIGENMDIFVDQDITDVIHCQWTFSGQLEGE